MAGQNANNGGNANSNAANDGGNANSNAANDGGNANSNAANDNQQIDVSEITRSAIQQGRASVFEQFNIDDGAEGLRKVMTEFNELKKNAGKSQNNSCPEQRWYGSS